MSLPDYPISREETYLSNIAGENTALPAYPISRKEQYLEYIAQHGSGSDPDAVHYSADYKSDAKKAVARTNISVYSQAEVDQLMSSKADKLTVIADTTSTTATLTMATNTKYTFALALTAVTLSAVADNSYLQFTAGSGIYVSVPNTVVWAVADPVFTAGKTYSIHFTAIGSTYLAEWLAV